jgi:hypothetical protein
LRVVESGSTKQKIDSIFEYRSNLAPTRPQTTPLVSKLFSRPRRARLSREPEKYYFFERKKKKKNRQTRVDELCWTRHSNQSSDTHFIVCYVFLQRKSWIPICNTVKSTNTKAFRLKKQVLKN